MHCTICKGPFHPATGSYEGPDRRWCGACARGLYTMLKSFLPRRWGGVRFYDLAVPPPAEAPVGWRPEDV